MNLQNKKIEVYVDGSFIDDKVGYGAVILADGIVVQELSGSIAPEVAMGTRQVAGEMFALGFALKWCQSQGVQQVSVYYDYLGVECWATGRWKAKMALTQRYAEFVRGSGVSIAWRKVKSHSGDKWNDRADVLAKQGAGGGTSAPNLRRQDNNTPLVDELEETTAAFNAFLIGERFDARYEGVFNGQYTRLGIYLDGARVGLFDLYNTVKKPMSPYLHAFKDKPLEQLVRRKWQAFAAANKT